VMGGRGGNKGVVKGLHVMQGVVTKSKTSCQRRVFLGIMSLCLQGGCQGVVRGGMHALTHSHLLHLHHLLLLLLHVH